MVRKITSNSVMVAAILIIIFAQISLFPQVSLRNKIGQMVMVGFDGTALSDSLSYDLSHRNLGGVMYLESNISNPSQVAALSAKIKLAASTIPFISTDQEGGKVARLNSDNGFADSYTALQLGTLFNSEDSTRKTAAEFAQWLSLTGINMNLAPVTDVNVNPSSPAIGRYQRSFSAIPAQVAKHAGFFIDEMHRKNVLATVKHFPGHGSALQDSHLGFTDITNTWADSELVPYKVLFASGYSDFVMIGHLFNKRLDTLYPATLSYNVITGLLRKNLGYNSVVITDDMLMKAISNNYSFDKAIELSINAGVDILLYATNMQNNKSITGQVIDIIESKVKAGVIPESRINESYTRIMELKNRLINPNWIAQHKNNKLAAPNFTLESYPNPFNPTTVIKVKLGVSTYVRIKIYDVTGRIVEELARGNMAAGEYKYTFSGNNLASGIYFVRMETPDIAISKKIALIK